MTMLSHRTFYRVIYGDTDNMGHAYYANYFRWFEIGRTELFRHLGLPYREVESRGILLPVSETFCKFRQSVRYDDLIMIETALDEGVRAGMKFNYSLLDEGGSVLLAEGYTRHACVNSAGRVVRPPAMLSAFIQKCRESGSGTSAQSAETCVYSHADRHRSLEKPPHPGGGRPDGG